MKEYMVLEVNKSKMEELMNSMAKEGWEVVSTSYWSGFKLCMIVTFSREIPQKSTPAER